jgi:hypothetical protein
LLVDERLGVGVEVLADLGHRHLDSLGQRVANKEIRS